VQPPAVAVQPPALEQGVAAVQPPARLAAGQVDQLWRHTYRRNCCPAPAEHHSLGKHAHRLRVRSMAQAQLALAPHRSYHRTPHPLAPTHHTQSTW
jgi:hypothetical protein